MAGSRSFPPLSGSTATLVPVVAYLLLFMGGIIPSVHTCSESERSALLSLKAANPGAAATWLSSWSGRHCCGWRGVRCDRNTTRHVTELHLECPGDTCLSQVPPSILNFTHLKHLDLSFNSFNGAPIPAFIGSLAHLEYLNLCDADFGGAIPHHIGNLSNLRHLDLHDNSGLSSDGDGLRWLSGNPSLRHLDMGGINLSSATNWVRDITPLSSLKVLLLYAVGLQGFDRHEALNLSSLLTLDLSYNYIASTVPIWFFQLDNLQRLDLSDNSLYGGFPTDMNISSSLSILDLSANSFTSTVPSCLFSTGNLRHLDLSTNSFNGVSSISNASSSNLQSLSLSFNNLTAKDVKCLKDLTRLKELELARCNITGEILESIMSLSHLRRLALDENKITGRIPENIGNLRHLKYLDLSYNQIVGEIPESIGNIRGLQHVHLGLNRITGKIPKTIGNLTRLVNLFFMSNRITGEIPNTIGNMRNLVNLYLSDNLINGSIPETIGKLSKLEGFNLSANHITGMIPESMGKLRRLEDLGLSSNHLHGEIPATMGDLCALNTLDFSNNSIGGGITALIDGFSRCNSNNQFTNLYKLHMGYNKLNGSVPESLGLLSSMTELNFTSNSLTGHLTEAHFSNITGLKVLDLSHNLIAGELPRSLRIHTLVLYLSYNRFEGLLPDLGPEVELLDIRNNMFSGPIPVSYWEAVSIRSLAMSHNRINGSIPLFLCNMTYLELVDLSDNDISGGIPDCWSNDSPVRVMDLSSNNLSGRIPSTFGLLAQLQSLHLGNNSLFGEIPLAMKACTGLLTLDLGGNLLSGSIPLWLGDSLSSLAVLRLRSNLLNGAIPLTLTHLRSLRVLDLAHNNISGGLPHSFGNFTAMASAINADKLLHGEYWVLSTKVTSQIYYEGELYYEENILVVAKGLQLEFTKVLSLVTSIDLSNNSLSGEIPEELTNLHGLHFLNLSANHFLGQIPRNIGNMGQLESFDLSMNNLSGRIPDSMTDLDYLSQLNLSNNNLSGRIPSGKQFQTFNDPSIYMGNLYLCGWPLSDCNRHEPSKDDGDGGGDGFETIWIYASSAIGFIVGFWALIGTIVMKQAIRIAYFNYMDGAYDWVYVQVVVSFRRIKSRMVKINQNRR